MTGFRRGADRAFRASALPRINTSGDARNSNRFAKSPSLMTAATFASCKILSIRATGDFGSIGT